MIIDTSKTESALYHIGCRPGEVGRYVLLPGDPGRVPIIAELLDEPKKIAHNREYMTYTGKLLGEKVSVTSTGMGCPSTAIAVEELKMAGADTFIRVGTSGIMQKFIEPGDLIIAWGSIRDEYTSQQYIPLEFPAVADLDVTLSLRQAARDFKVSHHFGMTQIKGGTLCSEMEASTIFVVSSFLKCRAGGIMLAGGTDSDLDVLLNTAVSGLKILIEKDQNKMG
jgi:uridine phosphorylase